MRIRRCRQQQCSGRFMYTGRTLADGHQCAPPISSKVSRSNPAISVTETQVVQHVTVFDGWHSILISLYMALVCYGVLVGIPVISTAWVNLLGFS